MLRSLWSLLTSADKRTRVPVRRQPRSLHLEPLEARALMSVSPVIVTVAGTGTGGFSGDGGSAKTAHLDQPSGLAVDSKGNLYVVDDYNERVREVTATGTIKTIAGNGVVGDFGNGGPATKASFQFGTGGGVTVNALGDVFIADPTKNEVREVLTNGTITAFAGSFTGGGHTGDGSPATRAQLGTPFGVAIDAKGDVFIADTLNNDIREVLANGTIETIAGTGAAGYSGDGGVATRARLNQPSDIAVDSKGDIFFIDSGNNVVREITTAGVIETVAGNGKSGFSGDGGLATKAELNFTGEGGVAVDAKGDLFIADSGNNRIRMVTTSGVIKTIAGTGAAGYSGDNGVATRARLNNPTGVAVDAKGDLFIADTFNNRIREILNASSI